MYEGYLMPLRILLIEEHLRCFLKVCFFSHNCSVRSSNVFLPEAQTPCTVRGECTLCEGCTACGCLVSCGKQSRRAVDKGQPGLPMPLQSTNESVYRSTDSRKVLGTQLWLTAEILQMFHVELGCLGMEKLSNVVRDTVSFSLKTPSTS